MQSAPQTTALLLRGVVPIRFGREVPAGSSDFLIDADACVARGPTAAPNARIVQGNGANVSPAG